MVRPISLNDKLHLVVPIYGDDGESITAYVHSAPISREVFESHFLLISKTFSAIYGEGLGPLGGPRVASLMLQKVAEQMKDEGSALALLNEIRRLSNVVSRGRLGWQSQPFQEAVDHKTLSEDDLSEVQNAIVFFIIVSAMHRKQQLRTMLDGAVKLWGAQISSSDFTAFVASLGTSTHAVATTNHPTPESSVAF